MQSERLGWLVVSCFSLCWFVATSVGQQDEMEIIERANQLLEQLEDPDVAKRDEAQAKLIELGPMVLDQMELDDDATTDFRIRVAKIWRQLENEVVAAVSKASRVTLSGEMTVSEALAAISKQTGNQVKVGGVEVGARKIKLDLQNQTFWQSLRSVMEQGGLVIDKYGGAAGLLKLVPAAIVSEGAAKQASPPTDNAKIFNVEVTRVDSSVNLKWPDQNYTTVTLVVRWEPRLRPISVDMPMSKITIKDGADAPAQVADLNSVLYGTPQPELPELEFSLPLARIDRQVKSLKSIQATIDAILPGRIETFRFRNVIDQRIGRSVQKAGATVTYGGIEKNEDIHMVTLSLSFEEENNALESHQGWVFENEVFLEAQNGEREEAIGFETVQQDNSKITIRYLFLEDPGNKTLVYRTPAAIVKMPVTIELKKIPLP